MNKIGFVSQYDFESETDEKYKKASMRSMEFLTQFWSFIKGQSKEDHRVHEGIIVICHKIRRRIG